MKDNEHPEYWKRAAQPILEKLNSNQLLSIKEGLLEFKNWVYNYNQTYVANSLCSADLSIFGYHYENWENEGDLWPNPLFDNLLITHKKSLDTIDLKNLIQALFNQNEDYQDCKATYTAMQCLLANKNEAIEYFLVDTMLYALEAYEPGHRYFEKTLLDRLVDDILPRFSIPPIIKLLQNAHPDNIRGQHYGGHGDDFISLAHKALKSSPTKEEQNILESLVNKYS